jgi:hypothetical protein
MQNSREPCSDEWENGDEQWHESWCSPGLQNPRRFERLALPRLRGIRRTVSLRSAPHRIPGGDLSCLINAPEFGSLTLRSFGNNFS